MVTTANHTALRNWFGYRPFWKQFTLCMAIVFMFCNLSANNTATAATYYVDDVNGNDTNTGVDWSHSWKTIPYTWSAARGGNTITDGDTVLFKNGNYGVFSETHKTHSDWITYQAYTGHTTVVFTAINVDSWDGYIIDSYLRFNGIVVGGCDVIRVNHLDFLNLHIIGKGYATLNIGEPYSQGIHLRESAYILINNCEITGTGTSYNTYSSVSGMSGVNFGKGFRYGIMNAEGYICQHITITNCNIHGNDVGILMGGSDWLVSNNEISYCSTDGIDIGASNIVSSGLTAPMIIRNNNIHHLGQFGDGVSTINGQVASPSTNAFNYPFYGSDHCDFIQFNWVGGVSPETSGALNHIYVQGNIMHDSDQQGLHVKVLPDSNSTDWLFENNLMYRVNLQGTVGDHSASNVGAAIENGTHIIFRNNTLGLDPRGGDNATYSSGGFVNFVNSNGQTQWDDFSGNIIPQVCYHSDDVNTVITHENYNILGRIYLYSTGHTNGIHDAILSPTSPYTLTIATYKALFNNYDANDFSLSANSLAIDLGNATYAPATDILGKSRVGAPDAGCYEYVGSQPSNNNPPIADAGPDQTLTASVVGGAVSVTLDGSSSSPKDSIVSYVWAGGDSPIPEVAKPTVTLSIGRHTIKLLVTDNIGRTDTDTVVITVEDPTADITPPSITSVTAAESSVEIQFSEPLDGASAGSAGNYGLSDSLKINSLWLETGYNRVTLYTDMHTDGKTYTLTVANVKDVAGNPMPKTSITYTYNSGLVGYYAFGNAGSSYVADSSGHNNTGYYINGAQRTDQQEANLGGGDDAVQISTTDWNAAQGTVSLWINGTSMLGTKYIFGHSDESGANLIQLYTDNGYLCVGMGNNHLLKTGIQLLSPQTWYHITLSWDGTNYTVYVNGSLSATGTYTGLTLLSNLADIGNAGGTTPRTEGFQGLIDEVRIYNRVLTAAEISNLALMFLPIGDKTVAEGNELSFTIRTRPDATMTLADSNLPSLPSFASNTFRWTPGYTDAGTYEVEFAAPHGSSMDFEKVAITVTATNPPDSSSPPIGYWKFDETSGDIASDSSAIGNTGYLKNGLTWGTGKINGAIVFSVPNDAVQIKTTNFNLQQGTVAMWVYVQRQTLSRHYFFGHITGTTNRIQLYDKYGYLCLGLGDSQETSVNIQRLQNRKWYHIVLTWNKPTYSVYVDGVLRASGTYSGLTAFADHADIGNNGLGRDMGLNGKIDDVHIYNRAITADEIIQLDVGY